METDNLTKFRKIVAGLEPSKREALMARMKGMSKEEAMGLVDRMVEISEQRKIEITARPKVLAGGVFFEDLRDKEPFSGPGILFSFLASPFSEGRVFPGSCSSSRGFKAFWVMVRSNRGVRP